MDWLISSVRHAGMDCRHPDSQDASENIHVNCCLDWTKSSSAIFSKEVTKSTREENKLWKDFIFLRRILFTGRL